MKTNPAIKQILFYGDSLVYGKQSGANARLDVAVRYTGVLQRLLGEDFEVIEEGLRGRMLSGESPHFPDRNGLQQFGSIIGSHLPVDVLVIGLGTNDCNQNPAFNAQAFAETLQEYAQKLNEWVDFFEIEPPQVLFVLPPDIDETYYDEGTARIFGAGAGERLKALRSALHGVAQDLGFATLDASAYCRPAQHDGIHLDAEGNEKLAKALRTKLLEFVA